MKDWHLLTDGDLNSYHLSRKLSALTNQLACSSRSRFYGLFRIRPYMSPDMRIYMIGRCNLWSRERMEKSDRVK